jgi:hypothetical protein
MAPERRMNSAMFLISRFPHTRAVGLACNDASDSHSVAQCLPLFIPAQKFLQLLFWEADFSF